MQAEFVVHDCGENTGELLEEMASSKEMDEELLGGLGVLGVVPEHERGR